MQDERGLAGAVRPEQSDPLAALDGEVDAEQRLPAVGIGEDQTLDVDRGTAHKPTTLAATAITTATREIVIPCEPLRTRRTRDTQQRHPAGVAA